LALSSSSAGKNNASVLSGDGEDADVAATGDVGNLLVENYFEGGFSEG
jgi:hypothetical protein